GRNIVRSPSSLSFLSGMHEVIGGHFGARHPAGSPGNDQALIVFACRNQLRREEVGLPNLVKSSLKIRKTRRRSKDAKRIVLLDHEFNRKTIHEERTEVSCRVEGEVVLGLARSLPKISIPNKVEQELFESLHPHRILQLVGVGDKLVEFAKMPFLCIRAKLFMKRHAQDGNSQVAFKVVQRWVDLLRTNFTAQDNAARQ